MSTISRVTAPNFGIYGPSGTVALTSAGGSATKWPAGTVVQANTISGHRDFFTKSCPGDFAYRSSPRYATPSPREWPSRPR